MQSGTLTVTDEGEVGIPLLGWPGEVVVYFQPDDDPVPCNPHHHHHHDHLEYRVIRENDIGPHKKRGGGRHYVLEIKWKVRTVRQIDWAIIY